MFINTLFQGEKIAQCFLKPDRKPDTRRAGKGNMMSDEIEIPCEECGEEADFQCIRCGQYYCDICNSEMDGVCVCVEQTNFPIRKNDEGGNR